MKPLKQVTVLITEAHDELTKEMQFFLKKQTGKTDLVDFQIYSDDFGIVAYVAQEEGGPISVEFKKKCFAPVSKFLSNLPEPTTEEGGKDLEDLFEKSYGLMIKAIASAWKAAHGKSKPHIEAYAREEDALEACNLVTGKTVPAKHFEARLEPVQKKSESVTYTNLSPAERKKLPSFFPTAFAKWSDEQISQEIDRYFDFCSTEFNAIAPVLTEAFKNFISQFKPEKGLFIDLKLQNDFEFPRLNIWVVSPKHKEEQGYLPGVEIYLGKKNPLQPWRVATMEMKDRLLKDSEDDLGFDISNVINAGGAEIGVRKVILRAWNSAGGSETLPTFIRSPSYNNQWIDMESKNEKMLSFMDVVKLSKR